MRMILIKIPKFESKKDFKSKSMDPVYVQFERDVQESSSSGDSSSSSYEPEVIVRVNARATCAALRLQIKEKDVQVSIFSPMLLYIINYIALDLLLHSGESMCTQPCNSAQQYTVSTPIERNSVRQHGHILRTASCTAPAQDFLILIRVHTVILRVIL